MEITLVLNGAGLLKSVEAYGHFLGEVRNNIYCAAATILLRTTARVIELEKQVDCTFSAPVEGSYNLVINNIAEEKKSWLEGITDFLMAGLVDLTHEKPDEISLNVIMEKGE